MQGPNLLDFEIMQFQRIHFVMPIINKSEPLIRLRSRAVEGLACLKEQRAGKGLRKTRKLNLTANIASDSLFRSNRWIAHWRVISEHRVVCSESI